MTCGRRCATLHIAARFGEQVREGRIEFVVDDTSDVPVCLLTEGHSSVFRTSVAVALVSETMLGSFVILCVCVCSSVHTWVAVWFIALAHHVKPLALRCGGALVFGAGGIGCIV